MTSHILTYEYSLHGAASFLHMSHLKGMDIEKIFQKGSTLLVIRSVSDENRTQSRFVKIGGELRPQTKPPTYLTILIWNSCYRLLTLGITQSMPSRDDNAATRLAEASWRRGRKSYTSYIIALSMFFPNIIFIMTGVRLKCYYAFFLACCGCDTSYIESVHIQCQASIYTLSLCCGHSWRVRLAKQETLTPPGQLVSPLVCRGP